MASESPTTFLDRIINDPAYHDYFALLKGMRNGIVYGVKIRFPHALLMSILFGRGDWKSRARNIIRLTYSHALSLAKFVTLYKFILLVQKRMHGGKQQSADTFFAGLIGGYTVFRDRTAINEQIVLYVVSRVVASFIPRDQRAYASPPPSPSASTTPMPSRPISPPSSSTVPSFSTAGPSKPIRTRTHVPPDPAAFSIFAALAWGAVMYIFQERGETIQQGMFSSMNYLYRDSEKWDGLRTLLWKNK